MKKLKSCREEKKGQVRLGKKALKIPISNVLITWSPMEKNLKLFTNLSMQPFKKHSGR